MSQKESTEFVGRIGITESPNWNLSELAELARQAYERKATKDCLDLTRAILLIDPDNVDANAMRSSLQSDMHQDLKNARAFLQTVQPHVGSHVGFQGSPVEQLQPGDISIPMKLQLESESSESEPLQPERLPSLVPPPPLPVESRRIPAGRLIGAGLVVVLSAISVAFLMFRNGTQPVAEPAPALPPALSMSIESDGPDTVKIKPAPSAVAIPSKPVTAPPVAVTSASATAPVPAPPPLLAPVAAGTGKLAVSSPTSVEIYRNDVYLGSVPVSLDLPAGEQSLEYRHGNLRRIVTHTINNNETTRAMITFDVSVQINAKPWAEVFIDGVERKDLGQTPLSGVRIPIGTVLTFENPKFQTKKYRVTGNETGIQIVFP